MVSGFRLKAGLALVAGVIIVAAISPWTAASAHKSKFKTIYSFCAQGGCADGTEPSAGLIADMSGNFFGATLFGGAHGGGTIFELTPNAKKTKWKYKVIYDFCALSNCADGNDPEAGLIRDNAGGLYGTTMSGGANNSGVVYRLSPSGKKWKFAVLYNFCSASGCADGNDPQSSLAYAGKSTGALYDGTSPLYGTASQGGAHHAGTAFSLTKAGGNWTQKVLYNFCSLGGFCPDGSDPTAGMTMDAAGNLFGTTYYGGQNNQGTVFELSAAAGRSKPNQMTYTVLHNFCSSANCADGAFPASELLLDASGNLFGTTFGGGAKNTGCIDIGVSGCGTAYKLVPNGAASVQTVLYTFCSAANCTDGGYPLAGLIMDPSGNLYGATLYGGGNGPSPGGGTLFKLKANEQTLYAFCAEADCTDGQEPEGNLVMDTSGNIFGTSLFAGANGSGGTVFELTP